MGKSNTSKIIRYVKSCEFKEGLFSKGWCPPHPTFFVRRSVYKDLGNFDINYNIASDVDLMMRFLEVHKIKSTYIPKVWIKMRMGGTTNKSIRNIWIQNIEVFNSLKKNGLSVNPISFFINKFISRFNQFLKGKFIEKILITGSSGFIGKSLCKKLSKSGKQIRAYSKNY